jgi:hypothetical protein
MVNVDAKAGENPALSIANYGSIDEELAVFRILEEDHFGPPEGPAIKARNEPLKRAGPHERRPQATDVWNGRDFERSGGERSVDIWFDRKAAIGNRPKAPEETPIREKQGKVGERIDTRTLDPDREMLHAKIAQIPRRY